MGFLLPWKWSSRKEEEKKEEVEMSIKAGNLLVKELISSCDGRVNYLRFFSKKELEDATDCYSETCMLKWDTYGDGGGYKGFHCGRPIFIRDKLFNRNVKDLGVNFYFSEIVALSQLNNHRNVVKLLGCCLETDPPKYVYEFIANGSLSQYIENLVPTKLSWRNRLRIAAEVADAITYMHTAGPSPIVHRDIKSRTILLDEHWSAKVSGFELSIPIPLGQLQVSDKVHGTFGHIAPEYLSTGQITEKVDVFGFGILLLEILTGQRAFDLNALANFDNGVTSLNFASSSLKLLDLVTSCLQENRLSTLLDEEILKENNIEQAMACTELALRCAHTQPEERLTMMEVAKELSLIKRMESPPN